jgi:hypothetical protein
MVVICDVFSFFGWYFLPFAFVQVASANGALCLCFGVQLDNLEL